MKTQFRIRRARTPAQTEKGKLAERIQHDKDFTSGRLSELARYIGFGTVAATFSLLSSDSDFATAISTSQRELLTWAALGGMATVLFDYFQYVMGYRASNLAAKSEDLKYQRKWISYKMRVTFFWMKQLAATLSGLLLVSAIFLSEVQNPHKTVVQPPDVVKQNIDEAIKNQ